MRNFMKYLPLIVILILVVVLFFVGKQTAVRLNTETNEPFWKIL